MVASWTSHIDTLQEDYKEALDQFNNASFLISQLETDTENIDRSDGRRAYHPIRVGRNAGVGARGPGDVVPVASSQAWTKTLIPLRKNYAVCHIQADLIEAMRSGSNSWFQAIDDEVRNARIDATKDRNRQAYGTADGVIAQCGTTTASTTVQLATATSQTQMRYLGSWDGGMYVDIGTVANPTAVASNRQVVAWNETAKTITIAGAAVTTSASNYVFRTGSGGASNNSGDRTDGQKELTGLQRIIDDTSVLHTVDPASFPVWKALVKSNSGTLRAWSEYLTDAAIAEAESRSGMQIDLLIGNPLVNNAIAANFKSRYRNVDNVELKGGWSGLAYSTPLEGTTQGKQRALVGDHFCPENRLFGVCTPALKRYETHGWKFVDDDGSAVWRSPDRTDTFEIWLRIIDEIACTVRAAHFVIEDLDQPTA